MRRSWFGPAALFLVACGGRNAAEQPSEVAVVEAAGATASIPVPSATPNMPKPARPEMGPAAAGPYRAGLQAFRTGQLAEAEASFRTSISAEQNAYQAHMALGATLERTGAVNDAVAAYQQSLAIVPDFEEAIAALTKLYIRNRRLGEAESLLNTARSRHPASAAILAALAEVKSVQHDSAAAQHLAQQALKTEPDYRPAMVVLARDHYRNRRLDLAQYALTAILDGYGPENPPRDKNNGEARLLRALIYKEQGNRKGAFSELKRAVELRPDIVEARLNLAAYMLEAGNANSAVPLLEGALVYEPANAILHLNLGDAYRLQGRPKEALTQLEWVTQAAPKMAQAHYNIGLVYLFSSIDGVTPASAIDRAIAAFDTYLRMQPRTRPGAGDDADDLLQRARHKKTILDAMSSDGGDDGFD